jgi:hypothetical protein
MPESRRTRICNAAPTERVCLEGGVVVTFNLPAARVELLGKIEALQREATIIHHDLVLPNWDDDTVRYRETLTNM